MRPAPPGEETESPITKSGKDNKRKRASESKDSQEERAPTRKLRRKLIHVYVDSPLQLLDDEQNEGQESALVHRTRKPVKAAKPSELETFPRREGTSKKDSGKALESPEVEIIPPPSTSTPEGTSTENPEAKQSAPSEELGAVTIGYSPSLPSYSKEAIKDDRALRMPNPRKVLEEDPFQDCFTGVDDVADLNDASTLFEEAHRLFSQAIIKFRSELSQCEAELRKSSDEEKLQQKLEVIGQLRGEVDQVKTDCHRWKENMDQLAADKEAALAQLDSAETQFRGIKPKNLAQTKKIEELEAKLAKAGVEVAEARAKVERMKAKADKTIIVYLREAEAVQEELREASDREKQSNDLAKCQSRRETLEEIHARGFDLIAEVAQAKAQEIDARFLVYSYDKDVVSGSKDGGDGDGAPEEEAPEDAAIKDVTTEGAAPKVD
ncbi:PREDICTED: uncharacterized protein LOC109240277 [Nicotiana attenuata]|uniref:uncharacterized protein LOC109240277 n=1 Tax=Nicotiana attenuata TaxID=49451 RepID=UPI00090491DB|nr:PREDICTED: uncharacterized protein LOC109240277 [Nicotiana attenuata]